MRHLPLLSVLSLLLLSILAGCADTTGGAGGDAGAAPGDGAPLWNPGATGSSSVTPLGKAALGAFRLAWWTTLGSDSGHKATPQVVDIDGDGHDDLLVNPRLLDTRYYAAKGKGQGEFHGHKVISSGGFSGGWGAEAGDVNGDDRIDVVLGDHVRGVRVYLGQSGGGFADASPAAKGTFSGAGLGDVDGDRKLDLVVGADQFAQGLRLFRGDGKGAWSELAASGLPAYTEGTLTGFSNVGYFSFADLDADGDQDLFAFGQLPAGDVTCKVYENTDGKGTSWTELAALSGGAPSGVGSPVQGSVGDVDGDGELDVAVGGTIHLGGGKGAFSKAATVNAAMIAHLGDLDGDGRLDLVTHDRSGGLRLYLGDGTGKGWKLDAKAGLPAAATFPKGGPVSDKLYQVYGIDVADLDGNGRLDIARVVVASKSGFITSTHAAYLEAWVR